jgi:hypothetical protein
LLLLEEVTAALILVGGLVIGAVIYLATHGHVLFVPILLVLPPLVLWRRRL